MFTVAQIELAHAKVKSGADFPKYIKDIKDLGVIAFETWVFDSHTTYFGSDEFTTQSLPKYKPLNIANVCDKHKFAQYLKMHK